MMRIYVRYGLRLLGSLWLSIALAQPVPRYTSRLTPSGLPHNAVTGVEPDRAGFVRMAAHDGLARYDERTVRVFRNRPGDTKSLAANKITWLKQTATGQLLVITPPFWATGWACLVYALLAGGLVPGFVRFRLGQRRQRQESRLKQQQEAEQLRAVDEMKTRFLGDITHELRTPLMLILSPAEKLLRESGHDAPTRQLLTSIHNNAGRLLRLVNQLLDLAILEGDNRAAPLEGGDVVDFVRQLTDLFRCTAATQGVDLQVYTPELTGSPVGESVPAPAYRFDAGKWETIITNLLANALKFTPAGGQVSVTVEPVCRRRSQPAEADTVRQFRLIVRDTGIGIAADKLPHIFDRFYQADDSRPRAYEGTGIGLALVRELTERLGGTITVQSRPGTPSDRQPEQPLTDRPSPPAGTTFTVVLPVQPATDQPGDRKYTGELVAAIQRPRNLPDAAWSVTSSVMETFLPHPSVTDDAPVVLVVDDNEELRTFVANELTPRYQVLTAADGEDAWEICRHELPDVVLSDVMMPRLDGYQLTCRIKSDPATSHIAVVLLTAKAAHESRITGLAQGADDYLTKPFYMGELSLRLTNLLTRQQHLRAYLHRQLSAPSVAGEPVTNQFVGQLQQVIESRLADATFGVDDLAQAVAISRRTLHRKLTTTTNLTVTEFIRHYRLRWSIQLLQTGLSVAETAYQVGFQSPSYFAKVFREAYQKTPSEFLGS